MKTTSVHESVMLQEVLEFLRADQGGCFLDCTLGGAGHAQAILNAHPNNQVVGIDRDMRAVERAELVLKSFGDRVSIKHGSFADLSTTFGTATFHGILADLGISSDQLEEGRGFSFRDQGPLDMRMNEDEGLSAADVVNTYSERLLFQVLKRGGVGQEAKAVVRALMQSRPLSTTKELADCVHKAASSRAFKPGSKDSATVVFQAIRMEVNGELRQLDQLLSFVENAVKPGGRAVFISFHSLEDREVAKRLRHWQQGDEYSAMWPGQQTRTHTKGRLLTKKACMPGDEEVNKNPRSRSARLRAFEFC